MNATPTLLFFCFFFFSFFRWLCDLCTSDCTSLLSTDHTRHSYARNAMLQTLFQYAAVCIHHLRMHDAYVSMRDARVVRWNFCKLVESICSPLVSQRCLAYSRNDQRQWLRGYSSAHLSVCSRDRERTLNQCRKSRYQSLCIGSEIVPILRIGGRLSWHYCIHRYVCT